MTSTPLHPHVYVRMWVAVCVPTAQHTCQCTCHHTATHTTVARTSHTHSHATPHTPHTDHTHATHMPHHTHHTHTTHMPHHTHRPHTCHTHTPHTHLAVRCLGILLHITNLLAGRGCVCTWTRQELPLLTQVVWRRWACRDWSALHSRSRENCFTPHTNITHTPQRDYRTSMEALCCIN